MIVRSHSAMLALSALTGLILAAPGASAADITRGGQPAELTVTSGGAHSVRVTLKPVGMELPPSPSLLNLEIKDPAIRLHKVEGPMKARVAHASGRVGDALERLAGAEGADVEVDGLGGVADAQVRGHHGHGSGRAHRRLLGARITTRPGVA